MKHCLAARPIATIAITEAMTPMKTAKLVLFSSGWFLRGQLSVLPRRQQWWFEQLPCSSLAVSRLHGTVIVSDLLLGHELHVWAESTLLVVVVLIVLTVGNIYWVVRSSNLLFDCHVGVVTAWLVSGTAHLCHNSGEFLWWGASGNLSLNSQNWSS